MTRLARFSALVATLALSACSSTPVHYHTLVAPSETAVPQASTSTVLIDVLPVGIPAQLDYAQLVVRQDATRLAVLDTERWAGPLADEVRQALSARLVQQLATQDVAGLPVPADSSVARIKVQVRRFDAWPGEKVQLAADWSLSMAGGKKDNRLHCHGAFTLPADGGYNELVKAQQQSLEMLANRIAADMTQWINNDAASCSE